MKSRGGGADGDASGDGDCWLVGGWVGWLLACFVGCEGTGEGVRGKEKNYIYKLPIDRLSGCYW